MFAKYLIIGFVFLVSSYFASAVIPIEGAGLVSYYDMNGSAASKTQVFNGSISGTIHSVPDAIRANSYYFNRTGYITTAYGGTISTVSVWYKDAADSYTGYRVLVAQGTSDSNGFQLRLIYGSNQMQLKIGSTDYNINGCDVNNQWQHIVVLKGNPSQIFCGGVNVFNISAEWSTAGNLIIGQHPIVGNGQYRGYLDEIAVWNVTLTPSDITDLYGGGAGYFYPFTPIPKYSIRGRVTYNSSSVSGATVLLINPFTNSIYANTTCNASGHYFFNGSNLGYIVNQSAWVVNSFLINASGMWSKSVWVNATVAD